MKKDRIALLLIAILLLAATALAAEPFVADPAATDVTVDIAAKRAAAEPNDITVYVGQNVTLNVSNVEFVALSGIIFRIDDLDIKEVIGNNKTKTFTFTADKAGELPFKAGFNKGVIRVLPKPE